MGSISSKQNVIYRFENLKMQCIFFILISFYTQKHIAHKIQFYTSLFMKEALKLTNIFWQNM